MAPAHTAHTLIRETALALRRSLQPSDDPTLFSDAQFLYTNRSNKLKRGAGEIHAGHLAGQRPYKKAREWLDLLFEC